MIGFQNLRRSLFWNYDNALEQAFDIGVELTHYNGAFTGEEFNSQKFQVIFGK